MGGCMARTAKALTALEVGRLETAGCHSVGTVPGLNLQVTPGGAKSWILRIKVGSKRREFGLGPYPAVKLAQAHAKAREAREQVQQGIDPVEQRQARRSALMARQAQAMTFQNAARGYIKAHRDGWKNAKHGAQWTATLQTYAFPVLGALEVQDVTLAHVLTVLEPIWTTKNETASRLRSRMELVLDWAKVRGHRAGDNPAAWRGNLDKVLPKPSKVATVRNQPAVRVAEVGAMRRDLQTHAGMGAKALEFALLTAARSGEVRGATWAEIDQQAGVWTVPAARMKGGKEHRVPLSPDVLALLSSLPRMVGTELVFPSVRGGQLSDATMSAMLRRMGCTDAAGQVCVPHGLRSTFRDWAGERTSYPPDVVEAALAHSRGNSTEAAYYRSDLFEKRRRLMAEWAQFTAKVEAAADNVVAIRGAA